MCACRALVFDCVSARAAGAKFAYMFEGVEPGDLEALMSCVRNKRLAKLISTCTEIVDKDVD